MTSIKTENDLERNTSVPKQEIKLYYNNVMANVIGSKHGITLKQLKSLAKKTSPLIQQLNKERRRGKTPYRDLPYRKDIPRDVKKLIKKLPSRCEILVVLGIGGSALGNIALDTALSPFLPNPQKKHPKRQ